MADQRPTSNPIALRLHELGLQLEGTGHEEIVMALGVAEREIERLQQENQAAIAQADAYLRRLNEVAAERDRLTDLHRPIPVAERLPTHIYTVLGFVVSPSEIVCGEPFWETVVWNGKRGKWQVGGYGDDDIDVEVTHWMDLPSAPQDTVQSEHRSISRVFVICNAYESGFGHGMQGDGLPNPYTPNSEEWEAYQEGYNVAFERRAAQAWRDLKHDCPEDRHAKAILYSPPENLSGDPKQEPDIRIAAPSSFTWATHWLPLSILPPPPGEAK